jgi:hypothetical protein
MDPLQLLMMMEISGDSAPNSIDVLQQCGYGSGMCRHFVQMDIHFQLRAELVFVRRFTFVLIDYRKSTNGNY